MAARLYYHRWGIMFALLNALLIAFWVQEGFEFAAVNHFRDQSVQLPIIYSYKDSSLFQGDIVLQARDSYVTWFYPALGLISRYLPLYFVMLGLYVASTGLTLVAVYFLAETLFDKHAGMVAVLLWAAWLPNPGGDFLHSSFPTHTTTAIGLQLLGLALALRKRDVWGALLLGLAANINAMTSVFIGIVLGFGFLGSRQEWSWKLIRIPIVMVLAASPTLWWKFGLSPDADSLSIERFVDIMRLRLWYAVFPFSVESHLWLLFFLVMGLWLYSARFASTEVNHQMFWMSQGIFSLLVIGTMFTELYPIEMVIQLQLLRSTWVLNLFAMLYFSNMIALWLRGSRQQVILALGLTFILALPRVVLELFPLSQPTPYELYQDFDAVRDGSTVTPLGAFGLTVLIASVLGVMWRIMPEQKLRNTRRFMGWFVFAALMFVMPLFVDTAVPSRHAVLTRDWQETQHWIRSNTPKDAYFVTPPTLDGFRVYAQRASFSDWKDGTLLIFNRDLAAEWLDRMEALGFDRKNFNFTPLTQSQLCSIAARYHPDYAVVFLSWQIEGTAIFQNDTFAVLETDTIPCDKNG